MKTMSTKSSTVVIIGGGVIGLSTAYHLARKKVGRIVLLDKGPIGDGSSSRAAGITTGLLWTETGIRARKISIEWFGRLSEELAGYQYHNEHGCLFLMNAENRRTRKALLPLYDRLGVPYEMMDAREIHRRWPALEPEDDFSGIWDPQGGYSEPEEYIAALARRVGEMGVEIREHQKVTGLIEQGGRVRGVQTAAGQVTADATISTVHVWHQPLLRQHGVRLPTRSFVHQRYLTSPLPQPLAIPAVNAEAYGCYIRPASGARILLGAETPDRDQWRVDSTDFHMSELTAPPTTRDQAKARAATLVPALGSTTWQSEHVGLISFSMDGEPILGPIEQLPGLYIGAAFHSGGFGYNTSAGLLLAELVTEGTTSIDISTFSPNRFDPESVEPYLAQTIKQKDALHRRH